MRNRPPNTWSVAVVAALIGSLIGLAVPAIAAAVGDPMELGVNNTVTRKTTLIRTRAGTALHVTSRGGGIPLKLVSRDGSPPLKVNSSAKVTSFNADKLDGRHANGLVRVAFDASDDLPDGDDSGAFPGGLGEPLSVSITTSTAGWLVITSTIDAINGIANDAYACILRVDGDAVLGTWMNAELNGTGGTNEEEDCTTHGVQEVPAGAHTVTLRVFNVSTITDFRDGSLSAMFVPFDGTGAASTCTTTPCP